MLFANAITALAGFLFASMGEINFWLLVSLFLGSTFVIASACVLNNILDQDIDSKMIRTKNRAMVKKSIPSAHAVIFSATLGILGLVTLALYTNNLVVMLGIVGFVDYVVLYGMLSKRLSWHGTLVGSISGAIPIISGYVAVTGRIDIVAVLVFLVLFFWQMPEFYSIAIYRKKEYMSANIPVVSVIKGIPYTQKLIFVYTILFVASTLVLPILGHASITYTLLMTTLGIRWLILGWKSFSSTDVDRWAKQMFGFSLVILLAFSFLISIDAWLP